ncbi:MAG: hypothetical protein JKX84_04220 [Flavobacteriales bacterium]|nr:hypothetical protein [Flavobacteriales bacterium]
MKIELKSIAKLAATSSFKWAKFFFFGLFFTTICAVISCYLLMSNGSGGAAPHGNGILVVFVLFIHFLSADPYVFLTFLLSTFVFPYIYFAIASKLAIQAGISYLWNNNFQDWLMDKFKHYVSKISDSKSTSVTSLKDYTKIKLKIASSIKEDDDASKWQKRILSFTLKRINMDDVDFSKPDTKLSDVLVLKINEALTELARPSNGIFYFALGVQTTLLVLAFAMDY